MTLQSGYCDILFILPRWSCEDGLSEHFQMQKTRLNSDACQGIGDHWIDMAAEVGVEVSASLQSLLYLQAALWTEKSAWLDERTQVRKMRAR